MNNQDVAERAALLRSMADEQLKDQINLHKADRSNNAIAVVFLTTLSTAMAGNILLAKFGSGASPTKLLVGAVVLNTLALGAGAAALVGRRLQRKRRDMEIRIPVRHRQIHRLGRKLASGTPLGNA